MTDPIVTARTTITPDRARELLERNTGNRRPKQTAIDRYAADMKAGRWAYTGDAVRIDRDGRVIDGQHRLMACVKADAPFDTMLIEGLPPEVQSAIDQGVKRSNADAITLTYGVGYATHLASIAAADHAWREFGPQAAFRSSGNYAMSARQTLEWLEDHPEIDEALGAWSQDMYKRTGGMLGASQFGVLKLRFREIDPDACAEFFRMFASGAGLDEGHPVLAARNRLIRARGVTLDKPMAAAVVIKAWNKWRAGETASRLNWSRSEAFPTPR